MAAYLIRRLLWAPVILLLVSFTTFWLGQVVPGDPVQARLGTRGSPEIVARERARLGLDQPIPVQYVTWIGRVVQGDFGRSIRNNEPVIESVGKRILPSLQLTLFAMLISLSVAFPVGILSATHRNSPLDGFGTMFALFGICMPNFLIALLLIFFFGVTLRWLPISGYVDRLQDPAGGLRSLTLPAITLGLALAAVVTRTLRSSLLETLSEDYVRTARAKGLAPRIVDVRHIFRNALLPITTIIGLQTGLLLSGAVLTETVFAYPGMGTWLVEAIRQRDFPILQGGILFVSLVFVLVNLLVDVSYALINPRIRVS